MTLPGVLFFSLSALLAAIVCYVVHRWFALSGLIAAGCSLLLGWIALHQLSGEPLSFLGRLWLLDKPFMLLGREWSFTPASLALLAFLFFAGGLVFLLALPASQGWSFYPFGMGVLGVLVLALTARQFIYAVLFIWLAAVLAVFVLSGGRPRATTGAVRLLALTTLGVMPLLALTGYLGPDADPASLPAATILMVVGFGILLMLVPFHGQLVASAADAAPMVPAFMLSTFAPVVLFSLIQLGESAPALFEERLLFNVCRWLGIGSVALGGIAAAGQRRWGYLVGYAMLVDWGAGMVALGQGTEQGLLGVSHMLVWRTLSLLLVGVGLNLVLQVVKEDDLDRCTGLMRHRTLAVLLLVLGLFSLAGFPLTPGAAGRWPLIASLWVTSPTMAWVLILAGVGVSVGTVAGLRACLGPAPEGMEPGRAGAAVAMGFAFVTLWLVGTLYLRPVPWLDLAARMLGELPFLPG